MPAPIHVTYETIIFRLDASNIDWAREEYGLPEFFGLGDGMIRVVMRPRQSHPQGMQSYAARYPVRKAAIEDPEHARLTVRMMEQRTLFSGAEFYRRLYGVEIVDVPPVPAHDL